jgi:hypothetical protein
MACELSQIPLATDKAIDSDTVPPGFMELTEPRDWNEDLHSDAT